MKLFFLRISLFLGLILSPSLPLEGEVVYHLTKIPSYHQTNKTKSVNPPLKHRKLKKKNRKRSFKRKALTYKKNKNSISPWTVVGSIVGFIFLWLGLISLPLILTFFILGLNPFILFSLPIVFIILGILILNSALKASSRAFDKDPNLLKRQRRTFGIINLIVGAAAILMSFAFVLVALLFFAGIFSFSVFAFPLIGLIVGIYMLLNGISWIDGSYGNYTQDKDLQQLKHKKRLHFAWIGVVILGLASLSLFILSVWGIALIVLAAAIALLVSTLILRRSKQ